MAPTAPPGGVLRPPSRTAGAGSAARRVLRWLTTLPAVTALGVALIGPWFTDRLPERIVGPPYSPPGGGLLLGTDAQGRDVWVRLLTGGRPLVLIPLIAVCLTAILGTALGVSAGYLRAAVDAAISRLDGLLLAVPPVLVLLIILQGWGYSPATLTAVVVVTGTPFVSGWRAPRPAR